MYNYLVVMRTSVALLVSFPDRLFLTVAKHKTKHKHVDMES